MRVCDNVEMITDGGSPANHADVTPHGLSLDELLEVLSTRRRRDAIRVLEAHRVKSNPQRTYVTVAELTDGIIVGRIDLSGERNSQTDLEGETKIDANSRKALYVSLKDNHVPRLNEAGLVDYRPQARGSTLQPLPTLNTITDVLKKLETLAEESAPEPWVDRPW
ncbi:hypothetical protein PM038_17120 [Halorubrum ezzemoulense]|mgnify:FL=1|jgi:DNA-binding transcriptional ArsR family regulator|uniref:DUF7344 domain-containing protein n=1 Tax=Halorubrum ezzemoulense TaxID=337243 RepID=UPI00232BE816|nr:hypothetical protein [Halorubrum ezzemoulense]MDB2286942.1 hypothetical protein [Halorubrum ezzemoulense]